MKIKDKKLELIDWLIKVDDQAILEQIDFLRKSDQEKWASLEKKEREAIEEGIKELNEGKGSLHGDVIRELRKKYSS